MTVKYFFICLKKFITEKDYRTLILQSFGFYKNEDDELYLKKRYRAIFGRELDLDNPQTFNEKMQWLKLYDRREIYPIMVDKYTAKKYVADTIGEEYIIPTIGVWNSFDDINFDELPNEFVLKCTHDSGSIIIVRDKTNINKRKVKTKINKRLKNNYYYLGREWSYKNVKPRIIAEQYMEDSDRKNDLTDYKIHCYNGEPKAVQIISNRYGKNGMKNDYYDLNWKNYGLKRGHYSNAGVDAKKPEELEQLLELARKLSADIPFLRTDFYIVNHRIYFGEMTFFPASGFNPFTPESFDKLFGSWITLPDKKA